MSNFGPDLGMSFFAFSFWGKETRPFGNQLRPCHTHAEAEATTSKARSPPVHGRRGPHGSGDAAKMNAKKKKLISPRSRSKLLDQGRPDVDQMTHSRKR